MKNIFKFILLSLFTVLGTCNVSYSQVIEGTSARQIDARRNYIKDGDAEAYARGWVTYNEASAVSRPIDGTGGTPTVSAVGITNTLPIADKRSFLISKAASNVQGQGYSIPFTIDRKDRAKVLDIVIDYEIVSGTFVAGTNTTDSDLIAYVYDVTNSRLIEPSSIKFLSNTSDQFRASFQTSVDSTSYRLILHHATNSSAAFTFKYELGVYPSRYVYGTPVTDWTSFTPTGTATTNSTYSGRWRRVGGNMEVDARIDFTGAPNAFGILDINIPSGYSIDVANAKSTASSYSGSIFDNGVNRYPVQTYILSSSSVRPHVATSSGAFTTIGEITPSSPFTIGNTDALDFSFSVPIVGWSSATQMSDQADTRVVAAKISTGTASGAASQGTFSFTSQTINHDTHGAWSTVNNLYTVPVSGIYRVGIQITNPTFASSNGTIQLKVNGSTSGSISRSILTWSSTNYQVPFSYTTIDLKVGDTVGFSSDNGLTSCSWTNISFDRISGPSAISATETIAFRAKTAAGQSIPNNLETTVIFGTVDENTHGAYNPATGIFTVPASGLYSLSSQISFVGNSVNNRLAYYRFNGGYIAMAGKAAPSDTDSVSLNGATIVRLKAGDTVWLNAYQNSGGSLSLVTNTEENYFSIHRVGL